LREHVYIRYIAHGAPEKGFVEREVR